MASRHANSPSFLVVDSSVLIAVCSGEVGRAETARKMFAHLSSVGTVFYAPGVVVSETLYVLCRKLNDGHLNPDAYRKAVAALNARIKSILPPPSGEASLITRAAAMQTGFGCGRSADGVYIALAEQLATRGSTELVTFDINLRQQAKTNAPAVIVRVL